MPSRPRRRLRRASGAALAAAALVAGTGAVASAAPSAPAGAAQPSAGPAVRPVGAKTTWRLGSFLLPPAPVGTAQVNHPEIELTKPCEDCFITGFVPRLVYDDGSPADMRTGVMLHHFGLYDPSRPDPAGGRCAWGGPVVGGGDEREPWFALPKGYGYKVAPGPWAGFAELMNTGAVPRQVHLEADVYSVPASTPGIKPVTPIMLSVADACSTMEYSVPAGRHITSMTWVSPVTGRIVWALGHVHPGGVGVLLSNDSTGERICASRATYGTPGADPHMDPMAAMVTSMSTCSWDSLGTVRAGERLTVTSLYNSPRPLTDVMGIMSLAVQETSDLTGGTRAPASMRRLPDTPVPRTVGQTAGPHDHGGHGH